MGRILLVFRLVVADVRRHPAQAVMMLLAITVATAALSLSMSLRGTTETLYRETRAATAGPDVVALAPGGDRASTSALTSVAQASEVTAHSGPYRQYYTTLTANGQTSAAVAQGAGATPGPIDRPPPRAPGCVPAAWWSNAASPPPWTSGSATASPSPAARFPSPGSP
ncbi:hypothetical protein ACFHW2_07640 [Actinomadura sp. LOL_016]|uniref:hypothetical protein n=1 Tax=unclassified Actinomadura TaxID=2626254 RepID=UPI003A7FF6D8